MELLRHSWVRQGLFWGVILFAVWEGNDIADGKAMTPVKIALDLIGWVGGTLLFSWVVHLIQRKRHAR